MADSGMQCAVGGTLDERCLRVDRSRSLKMVDPLAMQPPAALESAR
jgi:hypothetical protein